MVTRFFLNISHEKMSTLAHFVSHCAIQLDGKSTAVYRQGISSSYNAVNIIIWYMIFPMFWMAILDYKLHRILFVPIWLLLCLGLGYVQRKKFNRFCDLLFKLSQEFSFLLAIITCGLSLSVYSYHC